MKIKRTVLLGAMAFLTLGVTSVGTAGAVSNGTTQTVTSVLVNRTGGITAWGTVDCTAEVAAYFAPGPIPADTKVLTNESWVASQPVGRRTMLQATYQSNYANPCFDNTTSAGPPYPWMTSNYDSTTTPYYVYSPDGAFRTGSIHIDLTSEGGYLIEGDTFVGNVVDVFSVTGFDLRAVRAR